MVVESYNCLCLTILFTHKAPKAIHDYNPVFVFAQDTDMITMEADTIRTEHTVTTVTAVKFRSFIHSFTVVQLMMTLYLTI